MTAQQRLALYLATFTVIFLVALLVVSPGVYRAYGEDIAQRKRGLALKIAMGFVLLLALPYFYDELVGFEDARVSRLLECTIGACAYLLIIDILRFAYRRYGPPARRTG